MQSDCAYTRAGAVPCGEQAHLQRRKSPPGCTELGTQKVGIYVYHIHPYSCGPVRGRCMSFKAELVILYHFGSFLSHFGSFWVIPETFWVIFCHFGSFLVIFGHFGSFSAILAAKVWPSAVQNTFRTLVVLGRFWFTFWRPRNVLV